MPEMNLNSMLSRFNNLEVGTIAISTSDTQKKDGDKRQIYHRHGFFSQIKEKIDILSNSLKIQESDFIVDQCFTYTLNPLYQKTAQLPKKIFVCGYCKEPFFTPAQYLKHCYIQDCPLNHQRSTYFFKFKNQSQFVQNQDLRKKLSKKQFLILLKTDYGRNFWFFSCQQSLIGDGTKNFLPNTNKCSICKQIVPRQMGNLKSHAIFQCTSRNVPQPQKLFKFLYFDQPLEAFVQDIHNFHINYNIISSFQNFYLKIVQNNQTSQVNKFYCSSCRIKFDDEILFLQHMVFNCTSKGITQKSSSHSFSLQPTPQIWSRKAPTFPNYSQIQIRFNTNKNQKTEIVREWIEIVNNRYNHLREILSNIYFCGQCLNFFETSRLYLAHCMRYGCTLNHPKSSHQFLSQNSKKRLKIQNVSHKSISNEFKRILYDYQLFKKIDFRLQGKNGIINRKKNNIIYACGKCQRTLFGKDCYIKHLFIICQSYGHQNNSHIIEPKNHQLNDEEYEKIIMNYFYAMKIAQCSFGYKYVLSKNQNVDFEGNYFCGSCETSFQSKEEFVYHSLTVCQSLESFESSHFIKKIYNPTTKIQNPLSNLFQEFKKDSYKILKGTQKERKSFNNELQIETTQDIEQSQHSITQRKPQRQRKNLKQQQQLEKIQEVHEYQRDDFFEQKKQNEVNFDSKEQKTIQNHIPAENSQSVIVNNSVRRFLRFNVDCQLPPNTKFYCGKCKQSFKTDKKFIDHLQQFCQAFQHKLSSHFYVSNKRIHEINQKISFLNSSQKNIVFPKEYTIYQPKKNDQFHCVCGQKDFVSKIAHHRHYHNQPDPYKDQHFTYLDLRIMMNNKLHLVYLPSYLKASIPGHEFVCPCKPWKKLTYEEFVKHLIKRHGGRTPKFLMRLPEDKNICEFE